MHALMKMIIQIIYIMHKVTDMIIENYNLK